MASWYVRSGATGTGAGTSWANATTTLQTAITLGAAGDTYFVSEDHAETGTAALTITFKGTASAIDRVLCVNHGGSVPPVSADLRTTAAISTTGTSGPPSITLTGGAFAYIYGVTFSTGSGATTAAISIASMALLYLKNCALVKAGTTGSSTAIGFGASSGNIVLILDNTTVQFGAAGDAIGASRGSMIWKNTPAAVAGSVVPTVLFSGGSSGGYVTFDGVDFSALSGKTLVAASAGLCRYDFINCEFPASLTVAATPTAPGAPVITVQNSDGSATNYRNEKYTYQATQTTDTTNTLAAGAASDGTTPVSWKVVTSAHVSAPAPFETFTYGEWIDTAGSAVTRTFEIANISSLTLQNTDIWVEAQCLGSSSFPIASPATTGAADPLAPGSNLTSSAATWNTLASPTTQNIAITFTPRMKGYYRLVFKVARASTTLWINPRPNEV